MRDKIGATRLLIVNLAVVSVGATALAGEERDPAMPRYDLRVGQELKYHGSERFEFENAALDSRTDSTVWVLRRNDEESWRLAFRQAFKYSYALKDGQKTEGPTSVTLAYFDLHPDGRIEPNASLGSKVDPSRLFPRLPSDRAFAQAGWEAERPNARSRYRPVPATDRADRFVFTEVVESWRDAMTLSTHKETFTFDRDRGVIERIETERTQGHGSVGKGIGTTILRSVKQHDAEWVDRFARQLDRYFEAERKHDDLLAQARKDPDRCESLLADAKAVLEHARGECDLADLQAQLDERLKKHEAKASYHAESAQGRARILAMPSLDWSTEDLEGAVHSLKGLRKKVVILDFWNRGCGWCIEAMPQVKQLTEDFEGRPVAVLGMNTDGDEEDARFVVDKMALNFPTLKASEIAERYEVVVWPTLIIIDQTGKVADIHIGYSPTLRAEIAAVVEDLLARGRAGRAPAESSRTK